MYSSIYLGCSCERLGESHSSSLSDIFCVAVAVDSMVFRASFLLRRTHDTACFINKSSQIKSMSCLMRTTGLYSVFSFSLCHFWWTIFVLSGVNGE